MAAKAAAMPIGLRIMALLGVLALALGLPALVRPTVVRHLIGLQKSPRTAYMCRIVGTMLTALGLILIVFAVTFWKAAS